MKKRYLPYLDLTPMIDIAFILLMSLAAMEYLNRAQIIEITEYNRNSVVCTDRRDWDVEYARTIYLYSWWHDV
jgi:biopolymer transport protein ExbD